MQTFGEFGKDWKRYMDYIDRELKLCARAEVIFQFLDGVREEGHINMASSPKYLVKGLYTDMATARFLFHAWKDTYLQRMEDGDIIQEYVECYGIDDMEEFFLNCGP